MSPFGKSGGDINAVRDRLYDVMWEDAGIVRTRESLERAIVALDELDGALSEIGLGEQSRAFNLSWHDWMNLENLILVSRAICHAAIARENSRGAHFREDFPEPGDLDTSYYTVANLADGAVVMATKPVDFTRIKPGDSLIVGDG